MNGVKSYLYLSEHTKENMYILNDRVLVRQNTLQPFDSAEYEFDFLSCDFADLSKYPNRSILINGVITVYISFVNYTPK